MCYKRLINIICFLVVGFVIFLKGLLNYWVKLFDELNMLGKRKFNSVYSFFKLFCNNE